MLEVHEGASRGLGVCSAGAHPTQVLSDCLGCMAVVGPRQVWCLPGATLLGSGEGRPERSPH